MLSLIAASSFFLLIHFGVSGTRLRDVLVGRMGAAAYRGAFAVAGPPVGLGASLGALALLHAQRRFPRTFAGLCLQSGSFFVPRFDRHESGFVRY